MTRRLTTSVAAGAGCLLIGVVAGLFIPQSGVRSVVGRWLQAGTTDTEAAQDDQPAHADHVDVSDTAKKNLGLRSLRTRVGDYVRMMRVPAVVRERPGFSDLTISSRVHGIVTRVYAVPGQAVRSGEPLFDVELTGEALATAQAALLDAMQQIEITDAELKRLGPAAEKGSVAARTRLQLEYERKRTDAQRQVRLQELQLRGLTTDQIDQIVADKKLLRSTTISMPTNVEDFLSGHSSGPAPSDSDAADEWHFTLEDLHAHPGQAVNPGDVLCDVAHHTTLFLEGQAFEKDIAAITALDAKGWKVGVEFGTEGDGEIIEDLSLVYLDNHVDPETQTFRFYVPLQNSVLQDNRDDRGALFRSWKFRPGQRAHILIPAEEFTGHIPVPVEAVVDEGPDSFVFKRTAHLHVHGPNDNAQEHKHIDQYEPIPVVVVHRDTRTAVLAIEGDFRPGIRIAANNAYQLHLAMKAGSGGGGHGHSH